MKNTNYNSKPILAQNWDHVNYKMIFKTLWIYHRSKNLLFKKFLIVALIERAASLSQNFSKAWYWVPKNIVLSNNYIHSIHNNYNKSTDFQEEPLIRTELILSVIDWCPFWRFLLFLISSWISGKDLLLSGVLSLTIFWTIFKKSSIFTFPWTTFSRVRTFTQPSCTSESPTTHMKLNCWTWALRTRPFIAQSAWYFSMCSVWSVSSL